MGIPHFNVIGQVLLINADHSNKKIPTMINFNISNVCISAKNLDRELFFNIKMTPVVRLIMPCTQLKIFNSRLKVPFVKSAHIWADEVL